MPIVWIDATREASGYWLWGMHLVERQVRELGRRGLATFCIGVTVKTRPAIERVRGDLYRLYGVELELVEVEGARELYRAAAERVRGSDALLLEGDVVYDERVLARVLDDGPGTALRGEGDTGIAYLDAEQLRLIAAGDSGGVLGPALLALEDRLRILHPDQLDAYVPSLRLTMQPIMRRLVTADDLGPVDRLLYRRTFKGSIDAVALYGYYHLVRWITRHLCRTALTPNLFTVLSILCVWGASPLLAQGHWGLGLGAAWLGVILDSVDGKLARLRLHLSEAMGAIEHVSAMPGLGLWYVAVGWYLSDGQLLQATSVVLATWILLAAFLLDKVVSGSFKALFGAEIFDYRRIDALFHLVAGRRNMSLLMLTVGWVTGRVEESFFAVAGWTVATLVFHGLRLLWVAAWRQQPLRGPGAGS